MRWRLIVPIISLAAGACGRDAAAPEPSIARVAVSRDTLWLLPGRTATLWAYVYDDAGQSLSGAPGEVRWSSSDAGVATVSGTGEVHAVAPGQATVAANAQRAAHLSDSTDVQVLLDAANLMLRAANGKSLPVSLEFDSCRTWLGHPGTISIERGRLGFGTTGMWGPFPGFDLQLWYEDSCHAPPYESYLYLNGQYRLTGRVGITFRDFSGTAFSGGRTDRTYAVDVTLTLANGPPVVLTFGP